MARFQFDEQAPEDAVYAPGAFDSQVSKTVPLHGPRSFGTARVVAVEVAADGRSVSFTLEVPDDFLPEPPRLGGLGVRSQ